MCTTCVSTLTESASLGTSAFAAGAAAILTGVRLRFPSRTSDEVGDATAEGAVADPLDVPLVPAPVVG